MGLRFAAIAPAPIDTLVWSFGDSTSDSTVRSPSHVYTLPGSYTVQLTVGGAGGSTAQAKKLMFVEVTPQPLGAACTVDAQCSPGLDCLCGNGQTCPTTLAQGVCTAPCGPGSACPTGGVCANLAPAGNPQMSPWQKTYCLPGCTADGDCASGFTCRELRDGASGGWVMGCFAPDLLSDDGAACDSPNGTPDPTRCASGSCLPYGARGMCATLCASQACPSYGACASFTNGQKACVARCTDARTCESDPWLGCEAPMSTGTYGFTVDEVGMTYCAPRRCSGQNQCGPDGICAQEGGAGFCAGQ
jgi:PKD repeat protein